MLSAIFLLVYFVSYIIDDGEAFNIRFLIIPAAISIISILMLTFLPDKETMIEIAVAKYATRDNVAWSVDQIKSIVDYIVQAMQSIK